MPTNYASAAAAKSAYDGGATPALYSVDDTPGAYDTVVDAGGTYAVDSAGHPMPHLLQ